jgi:hypothetical protein
MSTGLPAGVIALTVGLAAAVVLATLAVLTWIPVHRSPIQIVDTVDLDIPADFDALLLRGQQEGGTYVVTLTVRGMAQDSRYNVGVLVQDGRRPGLTYVYDLEYQRGAEQNYGVPAARTGNALTFQFPLDVLSADTYIVGLDATAFGPDRFDYVVEGPRESLRIQRLLPLPIDPAFLMVAFAAIAIVIIAPRIRTFG